MSALLDAGTTDLVAALTTASGCWSPALSPDGASLAFVSDHDGAARAYVSPATTWAPRAVSPPAEVVTSVSWSRGPGSWLMLDTLRASASTTGLLAVSLEGNAERSIVGPSGGAAFAGCWAPGGSAYAFSAVGPDGALATLLDVDTGARRVLAEGGSLIVNDVTADGRAVLRRGPRGRRHLVVTDVDGTLVRVTARDLPGGSADGRFTPDGRTLWFATDAGRDLAVLGRVALDDDGRPGPLEVVADHPGGELAGFELSEDGAVLVLAWNVDGVSVLEVLDTTDGSRRDVPALPWGVVSGFRMGAATERLVLAMSGPAMPSHLLSLDLRTLEVSALPEDVPDLPGLVRPELVRVPAHDGLVLSGWLYRPAGRTGPLPAVVTLHGGPEAQERPVFNPLHQCLVAAGFAVLAPNVRGSTGYGRAFVERDGGLGRLDAIQDVLSCSRYLVEKGIAADGRLGVHGASYGGYLVLASIVEEPLLFAAAVSVCGIADFLTFFATTEPWIASTSMTKYGDPAVDSALLHRLSPLHRLHGTRTPTLLIHGEQDTNVPLAEARQAHAALRAGGVTCELIVLPGEGHNAQRPESRLTEVESVLRWFKEFI